MNNDIPSDMAKLPDGSGFMIASFPLPTSHWIYEPRGEERKPLLTIPDEARKELSEDLRQIFKDAIRGATMSGKDMDFDPDAMLQNLVAGIIGHGTQVELRVIEGGRGDEPQPTGEDESV